MLKVTRAFNHCVGIDIHGTEFAPGAYEIVDVNSAAQLGPGQIDVGTAETAQREGWAEPADGPNPTPSPGSGRGRKSSSPARARRSRKTTSRKSASAAPPGAAG